MNVIDHLSLSGYVSPLRQTQEQTIAQPTWGASPYLLVEAGNVVVEGTSRQILEGVKNDTKRLSEGESQI